MSEGPTKPCPYCGEELSPAAAFCSACGERQEEAPPGSGGSFALVEDDPPALGLESESPPPAAAETHEAKPEIESEIELEEEPPPPEEPEFEDEGDGERIGDTVRMKLSDVVEAWDEDAAVGDPPPVETSAPQTEPSTKKLVVIVVIALLAILASVIALTV